MHVSEASYSIGDEPISRANLDTEPSHLVWYAFSTDTVVMSVPTKVELYQNKTGSVHIGLWIYNGAGVGFVILISIILTSHVNHYFQNYDVGVRQGDLLSLLLSTLHVDGYSFVKTTEATNATALLTSNVLYT